MRCWTASSRPSWVRRYMGKTRRMTSAVPYQATAGSGLSQAEWRKCWARWPHRDLQLAAVSRGLVDGGLDIELVQRALAHERAQAAQDDLDLPRIQRHVGTEIPEAPFRSHLQGAPPARRLPDLDPGRVDPSTAVRRRTGRPHPAVASVVPLALLGEASAQPLARFDEIDPLEQLALQLRELPLRGGLLQPLQQLVGERERIVGYAAEVMRERAIEGVQVLLAVHTKRTRDLVEAVQRSPVQPQAQSLRQRERFLRPDLHAALAQLVEEGHEHTQALGRRPREAASTKARRSCSRLSRAPRNGIPASNSTLAIPARRRTAIQSISSLVEGRFRSPSTSRNE